VYVGIGTGEVLIYSMKHMGAGPLASLAALHPGVPCTSVLLLPDTPAVGGHLLTASPSGLACYIVGRPPGRPPAPAPVAAAGAGECTALTWDAAAGAAVASMGARHVYVHPTPLRIGGVLTGRAWRRGGSLASDAAAGGAQLPRCRAAAVPARGGSAAGALFAARDGSGSCVALWESAGAAPQLPGTPPQQPRQRLAAHADGPLRDVRADADAAARGDGAGRLLLSLSAGMLCVHARTPAQP
jgi:hypothetical protein